MDYEFVRKLLIGLKIDKMVEKGMKAGNKVVIEWRRCWQA
jgi:hypothetical protein